MKFCFNCGLIVSWIFGVHLFLTRSYFQGGQCLSEVSRVQLWWGWIHERAQWRGQPKLKPTLHGWTRIDSYHANSEAAHHSECEHAGEKKCGCEFSLFQVTTTTKTIREVQYIGPDGLPIDFIPGQEGTGYNGGHMDYQNQQFADYQLYQQQQQQQQQQYPHDYNRPPTPPTPSERSNSPLNNHRGKKFQSNHAVKEHVRVRHITGRSWMNNLLQLCRRFSDCARQMWNRMAYLMTVNHSAHSIYGPR